MVATFLSCQKTSTQYNLTIDTLVVYGDDKENIFGLINDFQYRNNKVYILDILQKKIFIFNLHGKIIKQIQLRTGKGPGDFTMGLFAFDLVNDTTLAVLDNMLRRVQLISTNYDYISGFNVNFMPNNLFYRDSLFYISGNNDNNLMYVYRLNGEKVDSLGKPFLLKGQPQPWFSNVAMGSENEIYYTNPYSTEIVRYDNSKLTWRFFDEKLDLVSTPAMRKNGNKISLMNPMKGWSSICLYNNFVIATTYNYKSNEEGEILPQILLLEKNNGQLLFQKEVEEPIVIKSFDNGQHVFITSNSPYPHLKKVSLKINRE